MDRVSLVGRGGFRHQLRERCRISDWRRLIFTLSKHFHKTAHQIKIATILNNEIKNTHIIIISPPHPPLLGVLAGPKVRQ
jgi:hypothetical protein